MTRKHSKIRDCVWQTGDARIIKKTKVRGDWKRFLFNQLWSACAINPFEYTCFLKGGFVIMLIEEQLSLIQEPIILLVESIAINNPHDNLF